MGLTPIPLVTMLIRDQSEEKLRATIELFRFDKHEHNRERAHAARDELIYRAEVECGIRPPRPPMAAPPKPDDALQSVTPARSWQSRALDYQTALAAHAVICDCVAPPVFSYNLDER